MLANKRSNLMLAGSLFLLLVFALTLTSCDRRSSVNNDTGSSPSAISAILARLQSNAENVIYVPSRTAVVRDTIVITALDANGIGVGGHFPQITCSPAILVITQPDSTNRGGETKAAIVTQPGSLGIVDITVIAGTRSSAFRLYVTGPTNYSMNLTYSPNTPKLIDHEADPYTITATLVDTTQRGIPNQAVSFAVTNGVGRLDFGDPEITIPYTNGQGIATAYFYNTESDEINNPTEAHIIAVTSAPTDTANPIVSSINISLRPVHNTLNLEANPTNLFGDGTSTSQLRAILLDTDGHGISHDTVRFRNLNFNGSVNPSKKDTDEAGIALSSLTSDINRTDSCRIVAEYRLGSIHQAVDTAIVRIMPVRSIGYITVSLQKQNVTADGIDSSLIFITVQDENGGLIADGTVIYLANTGTGFLSSPQVQTVDGQSIAKITSPPNIVNGPKVDSIFVWGFVDSTMIADSVVVTYIPGPIHELRFISPETTITMIAGSGQSEPILVKAFDANGNPVANGTQVRLRNVIPTSSLTPSNAPTEDGIATSIYLVGTGTGDDNVIAFTPKPNDPNDTIFTLQPVIVRCLSSQATTMVLSASQTNIEVGGASCQIFATLQDAYGNPLSEGYTVEFVITSAPGGDPEHRPSFQTTPGVYADTFPTNINGQAIAQLYSGMSAGPVAIRACTLGDTLNVCNEKSLVTISSGPPANVDVTWNGIGEAPSNQTPERFTQVSALVWDQFTNYVQYGTAVYFSLIPDTIGFIEGSSYTGGPKPYHPDSSEGVAPTRIVYGCFSTFDSVRVVAASAGEDGPVADTSGPVSLPIYTGDITLMATPGNLYVIGPECYQTASCTVFTWLTDGGGCAIQGGIINYTSSVGTLNPSRRITNDEGYCWTIFTIRGCDIPVQPDGIPHITATVRAMLVQDNDVVADLDIPCARDF